MHNSILYQNSHEKLNSCVVTLLMFHLGSTENELQGALLIAGYKKRLGELNNH